MSVITLEKSTTARINGAKSHGPATSAGLTRSSRNALRHGLSASAAPTLAPISPVLPTESAADYQTLLNSYLQEFTPIGLLETELVETMAAARWRLRRVSTIENTLLTIEMDRLAEYIDRGFKDLNRAPTPEDRLAWTFHRVAEKPSLNLLLRYEATLTRSYARALKQLQQLQSLRDREELPNEPKPAPTPLEPALSATPTTPAITVENGNESAPAPQRATIEVSPRINDQHHHP
jgi:hypothetical protein